MSARSCLKLMLLVCLIVPVIGCGSAEVDSITASPTAQGLLVGQTVQFTAIGTYGHGSHPSVPHDVTSQAWWTSSAPSVATVSSTGLATAVAAGTTTITASMNGFTGLVTSSATLIVASPSGSTGTGSGLQSITIEPGSVTVSNQGQTQQFLAFGAYSTAPTFRDLTNQVTWISLAPQVVSITSGGVTGADGGLATAEGYTGFTPIFAETTTPDGTVVLSNSATFTCQDSTTKVCNQATAAATYVTVSVWEVGTNTTDWQVTAPSVTGTPNLIHCGPGASGGSVCVGTYPSGSVVTLTESGSNFNGWSSICDAAPDVPNLGSTCTLTLAGNESVGVIFN